MRTRSTTERLSGLSVAVMAVLSLFVSGCGKSALPPPVTITYRDSFIGVGKVIQITNNSSHHLYNVRVVGRNYKEVSSASVKATDHLSPHDYVEVGWMEFEDWVPVPGESVEVYCDDYAAPFVSIIPDGTEE